MTTTEQLAQSVIIMLIFIGLTNILKRVGFLEKSNSLFTSKLVLKITLPALIFTSLSAQSFNSEVLFISGIVAMTEILSIFLAFLSAKLLKLQRGETGALMLVSAFGMSTMLGYPLIRNTFPGIEVAMEDAVIISEIGVGIILFILGPVIAMTYGESKFKGKAVINSIKVFLTSPIFISIVAGICFSFIDLPKNNMVFNTLDHILNLVGSANLFLVGITIGLLIEFNSLKKIALFLIFASVIKLIIQPMATYYASTFVDIDTLLKQVAFIESSMPSAILVAIYAKEYNCKPELVSTTILVTLILSLISVPVFFSILF